MLLLNFGSKLINEVYPPPRLMQFTQSTENLPGLIDWMMLFYMKQFNQCCHWYVDQCQPSVGAPSLGPGNCLGLQCPCSPGDQIKVLKDCVFSFFFSIQYKFWLLFIKQDVTSVFVTSFICVKYNGHLMSL